MFAHARIQSQNHFYSDFRKYQQSTCASTNYFESIDIGKALYVIMKAKPWETGLIDKIMIADLEAGTNWTYSIASLLTSNLRVLRNGGEMLAILSRDWLVADNCVVFPPSSCSHTSKTCRCWNDILYWSICSETSVNLRLVLINHLAHEDDG